MQMSKTPYYEGACLFKIDFTMRLNLTLISLYQHVEVILKNLLDLVFSDDAVVCSSSGWRKLRWCTLMGRLAYTL